jgi:DNA-binding response OmpR family regulator
LEEILGTAGHKVLAAFNGKDGVQVCSAHPPDLVITDLLMPEKEGLESIQELRSKFPTLPIIAISGAPAGWKALEMAKKVGADETLQKPFQPEEVLASVERLLNAALE